MIRRPQCHGPEGRRRHAAGSRAASAILTGFLVSAGLFVACEAKIGARDPQAVRAYEQAELARRTPWIFPSPEDQSGRTPTPRPTEEGEATPTPSPEASASPTSTPSPTPEPGPSATPSPAPAPVVGVTPPTARTYKIGEDVTLFVTFARPVVWTDVPLLVLKAGEKTYGFEPQLGFGTETVAFRYTVKPGDAATALALEPKFDLSDGALLEKNGGEVPNALPATEIGAVILDGKQEKAVKVILPDGDKTHTDSFDVTLEFSSEVTLRGTPWLGLLVKSEAGGAVREPRKAPAVSVSGKSVVFRYTVQPGDRDLEGVGFHGSLLPGAESTFIDAVVGANGNPAADSLAELAWPPQKIKVAHLLPATAYAHLRVEPGRLFSATDAAASACTAGPAIPWKEGETVRCWQQDEGRSPSFVAKGAEDPPPVLTLTSPVFPKGALRFTSGDALRFAPPELLVVDDAAPRFVVLALAPTLVPEGALLLSNGDAGRVTLHPPASGGPTTVRFIEPGKTGNVPLPLPAGKVAVFGIAYKGSTMTEATTEIVWWNGDTRKVARTRVDTGSATDAVFTWRLSGMRFAGKTAGAGADAAALAGALGELLVYGSLEEKEQERAICYLAMKHAGFGGTCP